MDSNFIRRSNTKANYNIISILIWFICCLNKFISSATKSKLFVFKLNEQFTILHNFLSSDRFEGGYFPNSNFSLWKQYYTMIHIIYQSWCKLSNRYKSFFNVHCHMRFYMNYNYNYVKHDNKKCSFFQNNWKIYLVNHTKHNIWI